MPKRAHSLEVRIEVLNALKDDVLTLSEIVKKYKVSKSAIRDWKYKFDKFGFEGLKESSSWKKYSNELKQLAINDFLSGKYSLEEVAKKHEISNESVLRNWIKKYNSHRDLKGTFTGRTTTMTIRKTTWEERIQIVIDCLGNGKNYQETANNNNVSYQQVYLWVRKYEAGGADALKDKRGHKKEEVSLTPAEKIKLQMKKLERENERLRAENLLLKKVRGDREGAKINQIRYKVRYIAIKELHEQEKLSILLLCDIAGVTRGAYYKWLKRIPSSQETLNEEIIKEMKILHESVDGIFGYRQMKLHMERKFKRKLNHKRIYRLMKVAGLQSVIRRKTKRYKYSTPQHVAANVLNRDFKAEKPNEKWVTDVTEFKYGQSKKAYLSAIRDLYDGSIISYVLGHSNNNQLVFKTLDQATEQLNQEHPLIHSDRGYQYTSKEFKSKIDAVNMTQSMSRVGRCIDNGPMESFWGTLKCEKYYLNKYNTYEELTTAIDEYMHFYNYERYQKRLNGFSPMEYRVKAA
ncbi:IS3 family transposase [Lottiidibacillus patelloidae]|uniref:IS3 family transposase n=1 Tax=Lottiidibacillus patelloidae TaxID=2670334 RepID=A0A263BQR9_9BACI|nr:IS3 family transposase [Lottiidibacillus patelloidae]OZM56050.1 IS3 family transposase [Lottiidibacillus patelloidae]